MRGRTITAAYNYRDALDRFNGNGHSNVDALQERDAIDIILSHYITHTHDVDLIDDRFGDMVSTWETACKDEAALLAAVEGAPVFNRLINEPLKPSEEKINEDSPVDDIFNVEQTEAGNADLFSDEHTGEYLYNDSLGWLIWIGQKWADGDGMDALVKDKAAIFTREMLVEVTRRQMEAASATGEVPDALAKLLRHATRSRTDKSINAIVSLTKARLYKTAKTFDADPNIINTPAGIVDLRTGDIKPHDREAYCTKITKAAPSDEGREEWASFVNLVCCNDPDMVCYLQEAIGGTLFGRVVTEGLYIAVGDGFNGKSTFFNAIRIVLGDYAGTLDSDVLTSSKESKDPKLSRVRGKRLMICGELQEGVALSESFVKKITSTDNIQIKALYKNPEEIKPTHSICLHTNHLPRINSTDDGTWRRVHVLPFSAKMPTGKKTIRDYGEQLAARCGGAILQWAIDGAVSAYAQGFNINEPAAVTELLERYRSGQDQVQNFLNEYCITDPTAEESAGKLYTAYMAYCMQIGERAKRKDMFNADMKRLGYRQRVTGGSHHANKWQGLILNPAKAILDGDE